jgi:7-cyano-7-deazaguanine synthase
MRESIIGCQPQEKFLLSFSGGQDSSTVLLLLKQAIPEENIYLVSFLYNQKHASAEQCARREVLKALGLFKPDWMQTHTMEVRMQNFGQSALIEGAGDVNDKHTKDDTLPASFVPGRNLLFLLHMAQIGYNIDAYNLVLGVNSVDYSGYPDCRPETILAMEEALSFGFATKFSVVAPLIRSTKAEIVQSAMSCFGGAEVLRASHTCYNGVRPGCGKCPACKVRADGFAAVGIADPRFA